MSSMSRSEVAMHDLKGGKRPAGIWKGSTCHARFCWAHLGSRVISQRTFLRAKAQLAASSPLPSKESSKPHNNNLRVCVNGSRHVRTPQCRHAFTDRTTTTIRQATGAEDLSSPTNDDHSISQIVLFLSMSIFLLTFRWAIDHPITLLVPIGMAISPGVGPAMRPLLRELGCLLAAAAHWIPSIIRTNQAPEPAPLKDPRQRQPSYSLLANAECVPGAKGRLVGKQAGSTEHMGRPIAGKDRSVANRSMDNAVTNRPRENAVANRSRENTVASRSVDNGVANRSMDGDWCTGMDRYSDTGMHWDVSSAQTGQLHAEVLHHPLHSHASPPHPRSTPVQPRVYVQHGVPRHHHDSIHTQDAGHDNATTHHPEVLHHRELHHRFDVKNAMSNLDLWEQQQFEDIAQQPMQSTAAPFQQHHQQHHRWNPEASEHRSNEHQQHNLHHGFHNLLYENGQVVDRLRMMDGTLLSAHNALQQPGVTVSSLGWDLHSTSVSSAAKGPDWHAVLTHPSSPHTSLPSSMLDATMVLPHEPPHTGSYAAPGSVPYARPAAASFDGMHYDRFESDRVGPAGDAVPTASGNEDRGQASSANQ